MHFPIKHVVCSCTLSAVLFSGVAFAAQETADVKEPTEQCIKGGKPLSTVKTNYECVKQGGAWMKIGTKRGSGPMEKNKTKLPDDPLDKNKSMPPAGQIAPSGGQ